MSDPNPTTLLGGSGDLVSKVISPLIGVILIIISIATLFITLVTKSHDPSSMLLGSRSGLSLLKGSWDLVTRVINKVPILIITYNPN